MTQKPAPEDLAAPVSAELSSAPYEAPTADDNSEVLAKIAAKRAVAQAARRGARGKLHIAEPALALLVGLTVFFVLAPTQILMPLWGVTDGTWTVSLPIWLLLIAALFAAATISALRLTAWRKGSEVSTRHLGRRVLGLLFLATIAICLLIVGAQVLGPR